MDPHAQLTSVGLAVATGYGIYYAHKPPPGQCDIKLPADLDGTWSSNDPEKRWSLKITGKECIWTERNSTGGSLVRKVALEKSDAKSYKIARANDGEVLKFLGFAPDIQAAIVAHAPQPSNMVLVRDGVRISATWSGIVVIKDNKGKFKELKQPGQTPAKPYIFLK
jgi:hypothetical protein